eukprot:TRINITY_DN20442_c0_g1_i2.p1 TRINITY_DN20442_c0_g1~~TRINITY_DN20442_c0_g1_i2.p1  ORF type:complete len:162 (+),score=67.03 TRINITY_DN20442_c0_g1_i2:77-562(+)
MRASILLPVFFVALCLDGSSATISLTVPMTGAEFATPPLHIIDPSALVQEEEVQESADEEKYDYDTADDQLHAEDAEYAESDVEAEEEYDDLNEDDGADEDDDVEYEESEEEDEEYDGESEELNDEEEAEEEEEEYDDGSEELDYDNEEADAEAEEYRAWR